MLPRSIRRISTALVWIGVALIATGAALPVFAPGAAVRAASSIEPNGSSSSVESKNPDQVLREEAAAVRRRVEEFRERSRTENGGVDLSLLCYLAGAGLLLAGLVVRLATERRDPEVESR